MLNATFPGGRKVAAMVLNEPVNDVLAIVQCMVPGCQAHKVIMQSDGEPGDQIAMFATTHDCDPKRFPPRIRQQRMNRPTR